MLLHNQTKYFMLTESSNCIRFELFRSKRRVSIKIQLDYVYILALYLSKTILKSRIMNINQQSISIQLRKDLVRKILLIIFRSCKTSNQKPAGFVTLLSSWKEFRSPVKRIIKH